MRLIHFMSPLSEKCRRAQSVCSCSGADSSGRDRFSSRKGLNAVLILFLNATANVFYVSSPSKAVFLNTTAAAPQAEIAQQ